MKSNDGGMGGIGERCGMSGIGERGGVDDRGGLDDRRGLQDRRGVGERGGGHERALHRHLVSVGVAGGDWDGVGDRDGCRDDRRRVEGGRSQIAGCRCGCGAGQQGEESDDLVHGSWVCCFVLRQSAEERMVPGHGV